jgi:pyruvate dehydrogenase E2 component (dihydrolipoamide acetyltransferase)
MIDVVMPQMGESIVEGTLTRWLKHPGDKVERDEPLFEISTDKVDTEIPSPAAGVLSEVLVQEGTTVSINAVVARIGDGAGSAPAAAPAAAPPQQEAKPAASTPASTDVGPSAAAPEARSQAASQPLPQPAPTSAGPYPFEPPPSRSAPPPSQPAPQEEQGPLSPLVRKMARDYNIDLSQVRGTGAGGRITKQDLEAYMSSQAARTYAAPPPSAPSQQASAQQAPAPMPLAETAKVRTEPMSTMRQKIAEHMVMSKRTSAHVTTVHRVDMTKIAKLRDKSKAEFSFADVSSLCYGRGRGSSARVSNFQRFH